MNEDVAVSKTGGMKKYGKLLLRAIVFLLVVVFIWRMVADSLGKFQAQGFSLAKLNFAWLVLAGILYLLGSAPSWVFWHQSLKAMGQRPEWLTSLRAFFIGHLGKYVPGKAMVVILRAGMVRGPNVDSSVAAAGVFIETLTAMAVGGAVSAAYLAYAYRHQTELLLAAVLAVIVAGGSTWPPVFRRLVLFLRIQKFSPQIVPALEGLNARLMLTGWLMLAFGWVVMGMSLWATLRSLPAVAPELLQLSQALPQLTACVALAVVAGFAAMLPGGIGARELVIMALITPVYGEVAGIASAVLLRLVWLVAELVISAILWLIPTKR